MLQRLEQPSTTCACTVLSAALAQSVRPAVCQPCCNRNPSVSAVFLICSSPVPSQVCTFGVSHFSVPCLALYPPAFICQKSGLRSGRGDGVQPPLPLGCSTHLAWLKKKRQASSSPWVRVINLCLMCSSRWPSPRETRLVFTLEKSDLFSSSIYYSAKNLFSWHFSPQKKKKMERGNVKLCWPWISSPLLGICVRAWSFGLKCSLRSQSDKRKMEEKSLLWLVPGRVMVIYWEDGFKIFLSNEKVDMFSLCLGSASHRWLMLNLPPRWCLLKLRWLEDQRRSKFLPGRMLSW